MSNTRTYTQAYTQHGDNQRDNNINIPQTHEQTHMYFQALCPKGGPKTKRAERQERNLLEATTIQTKNPTNTFYSSISRSPHTYLSTPLKLNRN